MRRSLLLSLLLSACSVAPAPLQIFASGGGTATGTVEEDGKPAAGLTLSLVGPGGGRRVETDGSGHWSASGLEPGAYTFYYLGRKSDEVAYWKGPELHLQAGGHIVFSAIDVGHHGDAKEPDPSARVNMPANFAWTPYPGATSYGFEVTSGTGKDSKVLFRPTEHLKPDTTRIVYDGGVNARGVPHSDGLDYLGKPDHFLLPGTYTWSVVWWTKDAGQGQGPGHAFAVVELRPRIFPETMAPPGPAGK